MKTKVTIEQYNPYVGPRTFTRAERNLFFGRDLEARDLRALVLTERLVLFYAQSGAGKSSLINTCLIPALEHEDFDVLPVVRVSGEVTGSTDGKTIRNIYIYNLLLSLNSQSEGATPSVMPNNTLSEYLRAYNEHEVYDDSANGETYDAEEAYQYEIMPQVLIIDQFEEIITTNQEAWEQREDFFEQLREAMEVDKRLWIVLSIREDYIAAVEPYSYLLPGKLRVRYRMDRMQADAAFEAITEPAKIMGKEFAADAARMLVNNLLQARTQISGGHQSYSRGQFIEPVQLQVVCYQLWETLSKDKKKTEITVEDLSQLAEGKSLAQFVDKALAQFYEQAISSVAKDRADWTEFDIRNWFETKLITKAKSRALVLKEKEQTGGLDNSIVTELENRFLVRAESRAGSHWYELVHDRFVDPITQANADWQKYHPLIQAAQDWKNNGETRGNLFQGQQLEDAFSDPDVQIGIVQEFLEASREAEESRKRELIATQRARTNKILKWAIIFVTLMALVALGAGFYGLNQGQIANNEAATAESLRETSEKSQERAEIAEAIAVIAKETAVVERDLANQARSTLAANLEAALTSQAVIPPTVTPTATSTDTPELSSTSSQESTATVIQTATPTSTPNKAATATTEALEKQLAQVRATQTAVAANLGNELLQITQDNTDEYVPSFSPDQRLIIIESKRFDYWQIFVLTPDGNNWNQLTFYDINHHQPRFSPDGTRIAFASGQEDMR